MPVSFRNLIDTSQLADALTSGDFSKVIKKRNQNIAKYIKGYANDTAIEALANSIDPNLNLGIVKQAFGLENKQLDEYDPYHTTDSKKESFWYDNGDTEVDGKTIQKEYDQDTNTFKRALYSNSEFGSYRINDFWYEDPFYPAFELFFYDDSPFFIGDDTIEETPKDNSLKKFLFEYRGLDPVGYQARFNLWKEFKRVFFKIFNKEIERNDHRNLKNKVYYITKIAGLENLNHKFINYGEDKITITLNEDVSMLAYYISELYNNLIYSYRNQRYMFPENVLRFDLMIKINDIRKFQIPQSDNIPSQTMPINRDYLDNKKIKNIIAPESYILYRLHDCTFNFFESRNHGNEIEIGGYGVGQTYVAQTLSFDIFYKSVTRISSYPLIKDSYSIDSWNDSYEKNGGLAGTELKYENDLNRIAKEAPQKKGFLNKLLAKGAQTLVNTAADYADNLETKLREVRGSAVNGLLSQFRNVTTINKIEPDNVYKPDFNNRSSVKNAARSLGSSLLNDLEETTRNALNI